MIEVYLIDTAREELADESTEKMTFHVENRKFTVDKSRDEAEEGMSNAVEVVIRIALQIGEEDQVQSWFSWTPTQSEEKTVLVKRLNTYPVGIPAPDYRANG